MKLSTHLTRAQNIRTFFFRSSIDGASRRASTNSNASRRQRRRIESDPDELEMETSLILINEQDADAAAANYDVVNPVMTSSSDDQQGARPSTSAEPAASPPPPPRPTEFQLSEELRQKTIIAEWQRIAAVIDRVLFWTFVLATLASYVIILIILPKTKPNQDSQPVSIRASYTPVS